MSFLARQCQRINRISTTSSYFSKRYAHKKSAIQVKLNDFVEGVGIKDDIVLVRPGLMRNILYPAGKATYVSTYEGPRNRILEANDNHNHVEDVYLQQQQQQQQRQQATERLVGGLENVNELEFKRAVVPNSDNTFGSVTVDDLVLKLKEDYGLTIDKQAIEFKSEGGRIKSLGEHIVQVQIGDVSTNVKVIVKST
ncbi:uncharacterized protein BX664DRAFT_327881 [Halteromyces radiatus]|uniref:uncharacterized protein n=1 Tax=Halteromyces radiatus TaxID=101107 RepID=UPI0022207739|nr:uncharacterized protein BX664DRAFT_327881 [Halteromyces radiatus]KAI8092676.1 hypothetical protein BX664DRAFT_327881 [Halteromyces radiatus]